MSHLKQRSTRFSESKSKPQPTLNQVALIVKASLLGLGLAQASAQAATILVTSNSDNGSGGCTIREALDSVNAGAAMGGCVDTLPPPLPPQTSNFGINDTVIFTNTLASDTITLNGTQLNVTNSVTVNGYEGLVIKSGSRQTDSVIDVDSASLALNRIRIEGSNSSQARGINGVSSNIRLNNSIISGTSSQNNGGGIQMSGGSLTLENSEVSSSESSVKGGALYLLYASATLSNSVLRANEAPRGGGIYARVSSVSISNSSVTSNSAYYTGGISSYVSDISVMASEISNNTSTGLGVGGILIEGGTLTLNNSNVSDNRGGPSFSQGGGIRLFGAVTLQGSNSTINGNSADSQGAGIFSFGGSGGAIINLDNVTIEGNSAGFGGGISTSATSVTLRNSTIANNSGDGGSGAGLFMRDETLRLTNTIIANNSGTSECEILTGSIITDSATIVKDGSCNSQRAIDPQLGPLANNGGSTLTMALKPNSPARNTGILTTCEAQDQRGQTRNTGDNACDVGAIEFNANDDFGEADANFFVIPLANKKAVVIPL